MTSKNKNKSLHEVSLEVIADQEEPDSERGGIAANEDSQAKHEGEDSSGGVSFDADEQKEYSQQQLNEKKIENEIKEAIERKQWGDAYSNLKELAKLNMSNPETFRNMALCQTNLGKYIQSVKSLQVAADLDIKMTTSKTSKAHYKENEIILNLLNDI